MNKSQLKQIIREVIEESTAFDPEAPIDPAIRKKFEIALKCRTYSELGGAVDGIEMDEDKGIMVWTIIGRTPLNQSLIRTMTAPRVYHHNPAKK